MHVSPDDIGVIAGGGIAVLPTDTLYALVVSAHNREAVEHVYELRKRNKNKPVIILIAESKDVELFGVHVDEKTERILSSLWPGKVSVILLCEEEKFNYLHRGAGTLAFRVPEDEWLRNLLKETGPLIAPSANLEGLPPAKTIEEAQEYFGDDVSTYIDAGILDSLPSTLVEIKEGALRVVREGAVQIR